MKTPVSRILPVLLAALSPVISLAAGSNEQAELTVTETVLRPAEKVPPLGVVK